MNIVETINTSRKAYLQAFVLIILIAAAVPMLYLYNPGQAGVHFFPPCPFKTITNLHCPGCGTTRALHQLLHGELIAAWKLNKAMVLALVFGCVWGLGQIPAFRSLGNFISKLIRHPATPLLVLVLLITYWILRNIPYAPFTLLAPYQ